MNASTPVPPRRPTAGIDWASTDHAVAVVDPDGVAIKRCTFQHTGAGLGALVKALQRADVDAVGIERPDGPVVDALLEVGCFTVFVIAARAVCRSVSASRPSSSAAPRSLRAPLTRRAQAARGGQTKARSLGDDSGHR